MKTEIFNFSIPDRLIAQNPTERRSDSRLLVYNRADESITDSYTANLADFLTPDHFLVFNNSRVIPARVKVIKPDTGRPGEILVLKIINEFSAEVITDKAKKYPVGTQIRLPDDNTAVVEQNREDSVKLIFCDKPVFTIEHLEEIGSIPLPPYIKKGVAEEKDNERYQTTYSKGYGSAAAPTAGLHFDERIFSSLSAKDINHAYVQLHVGLGTFQPIYADDIEDHVIHEEEYYVSEEDAYKINRAISTRKTIIPVGTTSLRTLETAYTNGVIPHGTGKSRLYIFPPYRLKVAGGLITNFHTPKSSLAVLVSAIVGVEKLLEIYRYAVDNEYRFFSYGDSMLIL